jgi:hypothetical protein
MEGCAVIQTYLRKRFQVPANSPDSGILRLNCSKPISLTAGDKIGPYEILPPIGAGGMGEVYWLIR